MTSTMLFKEANFTLNHLSGKNGVLPGCSVFFTLLVGLPECYFSGVYVMDLFTHAITKDKKVEMKNIFNSEAIK